MRRRTLLTIFSLCVIMAFSAACSAANDEQNADESPTVQLPSKEKFRIVVLAGQSNMAGRGFVEAEDRVPIPRVYMLDKEGNWVPAVEPVHYDKPVAGVGPGREFGRLLAEADPTIAVGLVPTACGGSSINAWRPGVYFNQTKSYPYDDAISRTKRALEDGELEAILWRQGESDATVEKARDHEEKLTELFSSLRKEFKAPDVPILVGELYMPQGGEGAEAIRAAQIAAVEHSQPAAFISAEGTVLNPDNVHFDRKSQLEQGKRFFDALQKLKNGGEQEN
ncbi:MAG: sialate O-acetylesterase [Thermoguttaceae bacterium]|jgi:hypothetical protein